MYRIIIILCVYCLNNFIVEHGTFTPIVLSTTGGIGREAHMFFKKLADKLSRKSGHVFLKQIV